MSVGMPHHRTGGETNRIPQEISGQKGGSAQEISRSRTGGSKQGPGFHESRGSGYSHYGFDNDRCDSDDYVGGYPLI